MNIEYGELFAEYVDAPKSSRQVIHENGGYT